MGGKVSKAVRDRYKASPKGRAAQARWEASAPKKSSRVKYVHAGLRPETWGALWEAQGGLCYLCRTPLGDRPNIDHDHRCCPKFRSCSRCRRGLACHHCNLLIGLAGDDPGQLRRIADALEAAKAAVDKRMAAEPHDQLELGA